MANQEREGGNLTGAVVKDKPRVYGDAGRQAARQDTTGLAKKVDAKPFVPPKMEPNEDSSKYAARVARARAAHTQAQAMKQP